MSETPSLQQTAQEGLLGPWNSAAGTRQGSADNERDEEQEREGQDQGQGKEALPEHGPDPPTRRW